MQIIEKENEQVKFVHILEHLSPSDEMKSPKSIYGNMAIQLQRCFFYIFMNQGCCIIVTYIRSLSNNTVKCDDARNILKSYRK